MIPEPYLGLLVGSVLTLVVSIITIFVTNYLSEKHWSKTQNIEKQEQVLEQVYSPLFFCLFDAPNFFGYITGYLLGCVQGVDISDNKTQDMFLEHIRNYLKEQKRSDVMKNILLQKLATISPTEFRRDIFFYFTFSRQFEMVLQGIVKGDFAKENIPRLKNRFRNLMKSADVLTALSISLGSFLEFLISKKAQLITNIKE